MKNILITLFAAIAAASAVQAANNDCPALPEFTVSAAQTNFIDQRLEAVVDELLAEALSRPIPESVLKSEQLKDTAAILLAAIDRLETRDRKSADHS